MKQLLSRLPGAAFLAVALMLAPAAANATSYEGTTVAPGGDGKTYTVSAGAGDTVTLTNVGGVGGTVDVKFKNGVSGGTIKIDLSAARPGDATSDSPGVPNVYFAVTLTGLTDADISSAVWTFTVAKSWLSEHGFTAANVVLYHFTGGAWQSITTRAISSNDVSYTFQGTSTSFSPFAVTAVAGLTNAGAPLALYVMLGVGLLVTGGVAFKLSRKHM